MWERMTAYAAEKGWKGGNYKNLNLPFENLLLAQERAIRERMAGGSRISSTICWSMSSTPRARPTIAKEIILARPAPMTWDRRPSGSRGPTEWTREKIIEKARALAGDKGPAGNFDD